MSDTDEESNSDLDLKLKKLAGIKQKIIHDKKQRK